MSKRLSTISRHTCNDVSVHIKLAELNSSSNSKQTQYEWSRYSPANQTSTSTVCLEWKSPFQMPECQLFWRPHADMCIKHNCTPTRCVVRNLSVSAHQKVLGWHGAEHFLNANNVIYCARLANELGSRYHFANCANMHTDTIAHQPTHCNYLFFFLFFSFSHLLVSSTMQIYFTLWSCEMLGTFIPLSDL